MGRVAGTPSKIYVDEFNYSGRTNAAELQVDVNLIDVTCFADDGHEFVEGVYKGQVPINGFFDPADDNYDEQMWSVMDGSKHYLGLCMGQDASHGDIIYEVQGRPNQEGRPAEIAGAILLSVTWQGSGPIVRATVLSNGAVTATGAITNSNKSLGATAANEKFVAVVRCIAFDGTTLTVDIEQSSDDGSGDAYALITGMQQEITAVGVWRLSTVAATEAYKRVNITAFTGTSMTLVITAGKEQGVS